MTGQYMQYIQDILKADKRSSGVCQAAGLLPKGWWVKRFSESILGMLEKQFALSYICGEGCSTIDVIPALS